MRKRTLDVFFDSNILKAGTLRLNTESYQCTHNNLADFWRKVQKKDLVTIVTRSLKLDHDYIRGTIAPNVKTFCAFVKLVFRKQLMDKRAPVWKRMSRVINCRFPDFRSGRLFRET